MEMEYMHMGCDLLDLLVGGAKGVMGLPYGAILNIIGDKSSGKSFLKNEIIARAYHDRGDKVTWFSDDCESGDTFDTEELYGVNVRPRDKDGNLKIGSKKVEDSTTVEDMDAHVSLLLDYLDKQDKDVCGIYAIDSLDGLSDATREENEAARMGQLKAGKEVKDSGDYGAQIPKFLSQQFFRTKHSKLEAMKCALIIVSQIRDKFNAMGYGPKWTVACGKALEFYCHTRVFLTAIRKIERNGKIVGAYVSAKTIKSKTPRPFREVRYTVYFDYGIDNIGSNLDYLYDLRDKDGKLNANASAIKWEGGAEVNKDNVLAWLDQEGYAQECRAAKKAESGTYQISLDFVQQWVSQDPERQAKFTAYFGKTYTRDQLISMCECDEAMDKELTRRVIEKWEAGEAAVLTARPKKYGPRPTAPMTAPANICEEARSIADAEATDDSASDTHLDESLV